MRVIMTREYSRNGSALVHIPLPLWGEENRDVFVRKGVSYQDEAGHLVFRYKKAEIAAPDYFVGKDLTLVRYLRTALLEANRQAASLDRRYPVGEPAQAGVRFRTQRRQLVMDSPPSSVQEMADAFSLVRSSWPEGGVTVDFSFHLLPGLRILVEKGLSKGAGTDRCYGPARVGVENSYEGARDLPFWRGFSDLLDGAVRQAELLERELPTGAVIGHSVRPSR